MQVGAAVYAAGIVVAFAVPTPVGSNAERLALLFAAPLLLALSRHRVAVVSFAVALLAVWQVQQPITDALAGYRPGRSPDVQRRPDHGTGGSARRPGPRRGGAGGRPLGVGGARGARAAGTGLGATARRAAQSALLPCAPRRGRLPPLAPGERGPLRRRSPTAHRTTPAYRRPRLIRSDLPWLPEVWQGVHWRLYRVRDATPMADGPATVQQTTEARMVLQVSRPGTFLLRVRWSPWLALEAGGGEPDGCLSPERDGSWTRVHVPRAGRYTVSAPYRLSRGTPCPQVSSG